MKIEALKLKHFGKFVDFECQFNGNITRLVGLNGDGKTTVGLTAIWAGWKGIVDRGKDQLIGERFRFIKSGEKSADIEISLIDDKRGNVKIKLTNHITESGNRIEMAAPDGYPMSLEWLKGILNVSFMSTANFTALSSKEQATALGIDTSKFDKLILELKTGFTEINVDVRKYANLTTVEEIEAVSVTELLKQKQVIDDFNSEQTAKIKIRDSAEQIIEEHKTEIVNLKEKLQWQENELLETQKRFDELPKAEKQEDVQDIVDKIESAESINKKATLYEQYLIDKKLGETAKNKLSDNQEQQANIATERLEYIKSFEFKLKGLNVNDDGELILNGKPVKSPYFSHGELETICTLLHISINPELKFRFIDSFNEIDDKHQEIILKKMFEAGFQLIVAEQGTDATKENTILLQDCAVAKQEPSGETEKLF